MKVIILGAGQVGGSLAENLVKNNHDVTLVDLNEERLSYLQGRLDLRTVAGHCSFPDVLRQAGGDSADMLVAVTDSDEANMVACQVAYSLFSIPKKIARIRSQHYFIRKELFGSDNLPIDVFISPERLVTQFIKQLILHPGALQVLDFSGGKVKLFVAKPDYDGFLLGKTIRDLYDFLPDVEFKVVAIYRSEHAIEVNDDTIISLGDELFFLSAQAHVFEIMAAMCRATLPYKRVMIAGGGNIGSCLAHELQNDLSVKLIEYNKKRCETLVSSLDNVTVLCGDVSDSDLMINENIEHTDVFCALTNNDETNIISSLQSKKLGASQVMALVTRTAYVDLIEGGAINIAISPQQATVNYILTHMKKGDIVNVYALRRGAAEAIEGVARGDKKTSNLVGRSPRELKLPRGVTFGAIVRGEEVCISDSDHVIEEGDHVIVFISDRRHMQKVERLFQVNPGYF